MEFKDTLKSLRMNKEMTQIELADALGVSHATIGMYESGKRVPRDDAREQIADFFNVDVAYLMGQDRSKFFSDPITTSAQGLLVKNNKLVKLVEVAGDLGDSSIETLIVLANQLKSQEHS